jgi:hypothetical protein
MATSANSECPPLMEACTLDLYKKNIFRVTGLPVDASSKEVSRQVQKLQMLEDMGGGEAGSKTAFALAGKRSSDEIRDALSRMKEPEHRLIDEFFWFWPEEFGASKDDPAIQAILAGDKKAALQLWRDREKSGSHVAQHNMAVLYHMYAVDWTNSHIAKELDEDREDKIKACWRKAFERWEPMIEADDLWDMLKDRVRSLDDDALTTGFVRRILKVLPEALDRVNAEAALQLAEQGRINWAKFHIDFMRETHQGLDDVDSTSEMVLDPTKKRVEQYLKSFSSKVAKSSQRGAELADELLDRCRPMMNLFDLFHGSEAHQRNDLFDKVAETILQMVVSHQKATGDNKTFVDVLEKALKFAAGSSIRERILKNISIGEGNLKWELMEPIFEALKNITESSETPSQKLASFQKLVMPKIPSIASEIGADSSTYGEMMDTLAHALRGISIDAHNDHKDYETAENAIQLALKLAKDQELKKRIREDTATLSENKKASTCYFCGVNASEESACYELDMYGDVVREYGKINYRKISVPIARCSKCKKIHDTAESVRIATAWVICVIASIIGFVNYGWLGGIGLGIVGVALGAIVATILQGISVGIMKISGVHKSPKKHPEVKNLKLKRWEIGEAPST